MNPRRLKSSDGLDWRIPCSAGACWLAGEIGFPGQLT